MLYLFVYIKLYIQFFHQVAIDKDQDYKGKHCSLLGKPETKRETANHEFVQDIYNNDTAKIGNKKPNGQ